MREVISIDGFAGAGKTTLGHWLADYLGWCYLETGLLYRVVAWALLQRTEVDRSEASALAAGVTVEPRQPAPCGLRQRVAFHGTELSIEELRTSEVDAIVVTHVASNPLVRQALTEIARTCVAGGRYVVVGRDAGEAIVPDAMLKIVLEEPASVLPGGTDRARRRGQELRLIPRVSPTAEGVLALNVGHLTESELRDAVLRRLTEVSRDSIG